MEMELVINILPGYIAVSVVVVIVITMVIKSLDTKKRLKGSKLVVLIPFLLSGGMAWLARIGKFFEHTAQVWFWWVSIFGLSILLYETVVKKFNIDESLNNLVMKTRISKKDQH